MNSVKQLQEGNLFKDVSLKFNYLFKWSPFTFLYFAFFSDGSWLRHWIFVSFCVFIPHEEPCNFQITELRTPPLFTLQLENKHASRQQADFSMLRISNKNRFLPCGFWAKQSSNKEIKNCNMSTTTRRVWTVMQVRKFTSINHKQITKYLNSNLYNIFCLTSHWHLVILVCFLSETSLFMFKHVNLFASSLTF